MVYISGNRIYLREGDDTSFQVKYKDSEGDIHNFKPEDILTLTVRDRDTRKAILKKVAISMKLAEGVSSFITFRRKDYKILHHGDYKYDLVVETPIGSRHTLIDNSYLNILENTSLPSPLGDEFDPLRLVDIDSKVSYISSTPLICRFDYLMIERVEVDGTLIDFDKVMKERIENDEEDTGDDTLILFSELEEDKDSDDTLIIF